MDYLFTSERLGFRLLSLTDIDACETFWGNEDVMKYCGGATASELLPQVLDFYQQCQVEHGLSVYAVVHLETQEVIGAAGFNIEDSIDEVELIFHFKENHWGQGFATEAAIACLIHARDSGKVKKVVASSSIANQPSLQVLGKIGFQYVGIKYFDDTEQEEAYFELGL
ncbi:GNAT family N-acetyltransferase [Bacillus sp. B1-b2]|uniref:GNAT family N-acetyltransferase n=1 Tax=Bacillus sp. B1-b2 TaxID=2653201 RepID=UPI0012620ED0|nr:GNAT family N-acetyltransferase [Bacillus sp. B1-b2]KAB7671997.1 GNAT family N-acetyltransferase [Bacillus sp. B1-b2]